MTDVDDKYIQEALEASKEDFQKSKRMTEFSYVRRFAAIAACLLLVFTGYYALNRQTAPLNPSEEEVTLVTSPFIEVDSLEEAEELTGFSMHLPDAGKRYPVKIITVIDQTMIEVCFYNADQTEEGYLIRKAKGGEDISGDSTEYPDSLVKTIGEREISLKGQNGKWSLATWTEGDYSYAVSAMDHPMSTEKILSLVEEVR